MADSVWRDDKGTPKSAYNSGFLNEKSPVTLRLRGLNSWLLDLGSNQGPTDYGINLSLTSGIPINAVSMD